MALDLDRMRQKLNNVTGKGTDSNRTNFWKPQDGESNIRIVATKDGDPFKDCLLYTSPRPRDQRGSGGRGGG